MGWFRFGTKKRAAAKGLQYPHHQEQTQQQTFILEPILTPSGIVDGVDDSSNVAVLDLQTPSVPDIDLAEIDTSDSPDTADSATEVTEPHSPTDDTAFDDIDTDNDSLDADVVAAHTVDEPIPDEDLEPISFIHNPEIDAEGTDIAESTESVADTLETTSETVETPLELDTEPHETSDVHTEDADSVDAPSTSEMDDFNSESPTNTDSSETQLNADSTDTATEVVADTDQTNTVAEIATQLTSSSPTFNSGVFTVGETGQVEVDFLYDGGLYQGELAIFSLEGMDDLVPGSHDFIQEAAHRALSSSDLGHIVIADAAEGARFTAHLGWEGQYNEGAYEGPKSFNMRPGDEFGVMLVPNGTVQQVFTNPDAGGGLRPLFSLSTANPNEAFQTGQIADVTGDGHTFVMEDLRVDGYSDKDYNDVIFRVRGATGTATQLDRVIDSARDWRTSDMGQELIAYTQTDVVTEVTDTDNGASEPVPEVTPPVDNTQVPTSEVTDSDNNASEPVPEVTPPVDNTQVPTSEVTDSDNNASEPAPEVIPPVDTTQVPTPEVTDSEDGISEPVPEVIPPVDTTQVPTPEVTDTDNNASEPVPTDTGSETVVAPQDTVAVPPPTVTEPSTEAPSEPFPDPKAVSEPITTTPTGDIATGVPSTPENDPSVVVTIDPNPTDLPAANQPLVGIIDTGFSNNNPDIDYSRIILGQDRVDGDANPLLSAGEGSEHGTHVLGIIAAKPDNGIGVDGINNEAPIWVGRAVGSGKWAESLVEFVDTAKASGQPNAVVNLSFDLTQINPDGSITTRYEFTPTERAAIEYARQNGVLIVAASGNDGGVMAALGQASREFDNIITVGAAQQVSDSWELSEAYNRAAYSNYGQSLDIVADGGSPDNPVLSLAGDDVGAMAGTSVATARVTGAASQVWATNPGLNYRQVIEILKSTAIDLNATSWDAQTGAGLLNLAAALSVAGVTTPQDYDPAATLIPNTWTGAGRLTPGERAVAFKYPITLEKFSGIVGPEIGINLRNSPMYSDRSSRNEPYNKTLSFDAWTWGEEGSDRWTGAKDAVWFRVAGTNYWVPSAYIKGYPPSQPPKLPPAQPTGLRPYTIKAGDTLSAIAQRELGDMNRWREIKKANGTTFTDAEARNLTIGQLVYLPVNYQVGTGQPSPSTPAPTPTTPTGQPADYQKALAFVMRWEGGYVNHPNDPGGATNKGVTQNTYNAYRTSKGLATRSVRYITDQEVQDIYFTRYWKASGSDQLTSRLAMVHFDTAVNMGVSAANTLLQQARQTAGSTDEMTVVRRYLDLREARYRSLAANNPSLAVFLQGWLNRLNDLRRTVEAMGGSSGGSTTPTTPTGTRAYTVKSGDTLSGIAQRELGDMNRWREIKKADGTTFTDAEARNLQIGQVVYLPGSTTPTPPPASNPQLATLDSKSRLTITEIQQYRQLVTQLPESQRAEWYRKLQYKVPYFSQRDNGYTSIADVMCNVTTLASCLTYLGVKNPNPSKQFEDALEDILRAKPSTYPSYNGINARYWWSNFDKLARNEFGISSSGVQMLSGFSASDTQFFKNFVKDKWEPALNQGKAIMTGVYTTSSGHIVKVIDIDWERGGIIVDDPYGKAQDTAGVNYKQFNYSGSRNTQSRGTVNTQLAQDEGGIGNDNFWSWSYCAEVFGNTAYLVLG